MKKTIFLFLTLFSTCSLYTSKIEKANREWRKSIELFEKKKYSEAITHINAAIKFYPNHGGFWFCRALHYEQMKDYPSMIHDLTIAINLTPRAGRYYWYRASAYAAIGNSNAMVQDIQNAAYYGDLDAIKLLAQWEAEEAKRFAGF